MAILKVCCIFDDKAEIFNRPFVVPALGLAERHFTDEVNRSDNSNPLYSHPSDFRLYCVGEFDESSGALSSLQPPQLLLTGSSVSNSFKE